MRNRDETQMGGVECFQFIMDFGDGEFTRLLLKILIPDMNFLKKYPKIKDARL